MGSYISQGAQLGLHYQDFHLGLRLIDGREFSPLPEKLQYSCELNESGIKLCSFGTHNEMLGTYMERVEPAL